MLLSVSRRAWKPNRASNEPKVAQTEMTVELSQQAQRQFFEGQGDGPWTVISDSVYESGILNCGIYCALSDPARRDRALSDPGWDLTVTDGAPGFSQGWPEGVKKTTYHPVGSASDGVEPLVLVREYHGASESTIELDQQFRLFHNLRYDQSTDSYYKMNLDGTEALAVKIEGRRKVTVRTPLLRQYIAARQLDLLLFVDSVVWSNDPADLPEDETYETDRYTGARYYRNPTTTSKDYFTRYLATKVIPPGPLESCGVWPFEEQDTNFPEFIIGEDDLGKPVLFTCDPDLLANYFGANPDAPNYLTPVHFRREVLQKYYSRPELYSVEDGYLRCVGLWGLRMDNDHDDRIVVFLGDLGRDLPSSERDFWRGFMIPPDAKISATNFRRSFLAQPTDPSALDLQFRRTYVRANKAWVSKYGWPLFREPKEADTYMLQQVRLPLSDSQNEFEEPIKLLAKLMSDAINEKEVQKLLPDKISDERGISKLERLLNAEGYPHVTRDIIYLRRVQDLRSKVTAHLKGSDYEKALTRNLDDRRGLEAIRWLLEGGIAFLQSLITWTAPAAADEDE